MTLESVYRLKELSEISTLTEQVEMASWGPSLAPAWIFPYDRLLFTDGQDDKKKYIT